MADTADGRAGRYSQSAIQKRQVTELVGFARGLIADNELNDAEIESLLRWLVANHAASENPVVTLLIERIEQIYADGRVDEDERADLIDTFRNFSGDDFEVGEALKPTTLPLTDPLPAITIEGARFAFTGTFMFGQRRDCEAHIESLGGTFGPLTRKTDYLVIGAYATDSWKNSSFGCKIEAAVGMQQSGHHIAIVPEKHWRKFI